MDVAIASRELSQSKRIAEPGLRHLTGRIFNALVRWLVLPGLQDTQCGFRCFSAEAAQAIFPLQVLEGMSFDAEVLFIAQRSGYAINEVPIHWYFDSHSRVRLFEDSLKMSSDLLIILRNARRGNAWPAKGLTFHLSRIHLTFVLNLLYGKRGSP